MLCRSVNVRSIVFVVAMANMLAILVAAPALAQERPSSPGTNASPPVPGAERGRAYSNETNTRSFVVGWS
jgi:hypothetical protein